MLMVMRNAAATFSATNERSPVLAEKLSFIKLMRDSHLNLTQRSSKHPIIYTLAFRLALIPRIKGATL